MSVIGTIFPLFIIIVLIIVGGFIIKHSGKILRRRGRTNWLFTAYGAILIVSLVVFLFIPKKEVSFADITNDPDWEIKLQEEFMNKVHQRKIKEIDPSFKKDEWKFDIEDSVLNVSFGNEFQHIWMMAERREDNDPFIEVTYYSTPAVVGNIDVSDRLKPPFVDLVGKDMVVYTQPVEIKIALSTKEFPINQLTGQKMFNGPVITTGTQLLYLRIPQELKLNGDISVVGE